MIKNIIFDLGGVLVGLNRKACEEEFSKIGFHDFGKILNEYVQGGFFLMYEKGLITTDEFVNKIREYIPDTVSDLQVYHAMGAFLEKPDEEKLRFILSLRSNYRVFLLSNTNPIAMSVIEPYFNFEGYTLDNYFEKLFLSYQMKMVKPNKDIFEKVITDSGIYSHETLFVDDSKANVETAEGLGFKTILFNSGANLKGEVLKVIC